MTQETGNGLRRYMALWIFLAIQFVTFVIWGAALSTEVQNMHQIGGVPISTEARERLSSLETTVRNHESRLDGIEERERRE